MASPSAPTIIERVEEPQAPTFAPTKRDAFPNVALGIVDPPEEVTTPAPTTNAPTEPAPTTTDGAGKATEAKGSEKPASTTEPPPSTKPAGEVDWDAIKQRPEYQRDLTTALNKQHAKMRQEILDAEQAKKDLEALQQQQREYDSLVDRADDDSDPIAQAEAQAALTKHVRAQKLNETIAAKIRPTVEADARNAVASSIMAQYKEGFARLESEHGLSASLLEELDPTKFEHGGAWLETLAVKIADNAVAAYKRSDMEKEVKVRVAEELGRMRTGMPQTDLSEGTDGGAIPHGTYETEADVHAAVALGPSQGGITAARGRAILRQQFGRKGF